MEQNKKICSKKGIQLKWNFGLSQKLKKKKEKHSQLMEQKIIKSQTEPKAP